MNKQNNKRLLLTGIGGSIGVHTFAHIMHNTDWFVVGIDSFRHKGLFDRLSEVTRNHPDWKERYKVITHDLSAPLSNITKGEIGHIDYVINMASLSDVEESISNPAWFINKNVNETINVLEYARECKPEAFIQISTDEVYGSSKKNERFVEWSPIIPSNPYSASKACQEAIAISYWRTFDVPVIITNAVNNFGEMQSPKKFPVIVQNKLEAGEKVQIHGTTNEIGARFYLHSRNFADALLFILKNTKPARYGDEGVDRPDRYNVTSDDFISNLELAQLIAEFMGKNLDYEFVSAEQTRPGHDLYYGLSGDKLRKLGWKPPVSFRESLRNVVQWQMEHPEWIKLRF